MLVDLGDIMVGMSGGGGGYLKNYLNFVIGVLYVLWNGIDILVCLLIFRK